MEEPQQPKPKRKATTKKKPAPAEVLNGSKIKAKNDKEKKEAKKKGRPTKFTKKLADKICVRIASGESLLRICKDEKMPHRSTVHEWILDDKHKDFSDKYARARELQAEYLFDETLDISDDSIHDIEGDDKSDSARVNARKLQIETRQWYISKVLPKKYGSKVDVTSDNKQITGNSVVFVDFDEATPESK